MQKFILIRGHQGSGKSTFAAEQIAAFQRDYPNGEVVHIENDLLMTDAQGEYRFSSEALAQAQAAGQKRFQAALKHGQNNPQADILIVNSNTNQKSSACIALLQNARKHGFATEVYRLHNFYPNLHRVPEHAVLGAYQKLNANPLRDEIHVPAVRPISAEQAAAVAAAEQFRQRKLPFDESQQTFVTPEYFQFGQRDFICKASKRYPDLRVLKYARSVFYENRFDDALLEMRGLVLDKHHQIIVRPFKKTFNYSERIAKNSLYPLDIDDHHRVYAVVKINGFLGCCTFVQLPEHHPSHGAAFDGQVLYSTTGSLDSDFAKMTEQHCRQYEALFKQYPNHTFLFEITDKNDVHIIRERLGETLIGAIEVATGKMMRESELDDLAAQFSAAHPDTPLHRPETLRDLRFGELKTLLKNVKHEGFMVFDAETDELLFKLKSPFYLISKFFGRSNRATLPRKLNRHDVEEEFYPLLEYIRAYQQQFNQLSEQEKIAFIQDFLNNGGFQAA